MQEGAQQLNSGHGQHDLESWAPAHSFPAQSGWQGGLWRGQRHAGDHQVAITTQKRTPLPKGTSGDSHVPLCRWPPWVASASTKLLAGAFHFSTHTRSLWRPICAINCAWKPGTELPRRRGKWRKVHDQSGRVQLQDEEYLETPKACRAHDCQLWREFPLSYSSRQCRAMTNRLFVQIPSQPRWWCQRRIRNFVGRTKGCTEKFTKQSM